MKFLKIVFNMIVVIISLFIPNSKKYVVVGGWYGKRYADNSRGAFEYLNNNRDRLGIKKVFWFTKDDKIHETLRAEGKDVLYGMTIKSIYWHLRAGVHIIDQNPHDILGFLSIRRMRINLWHGIPLKSIGHSNYSDMSGICRLFMKISSGGFWVDQYSAAPSQKAAELLSDGLGVPLNKFLIMTYPRTIPLYEKKNAYSKNIYKVYYLPTFRENQKRCPLLELNLMDVNQRFVEENIQFYVKPHFASKADWDIAGNYSNFHVVEADEDVYEHLGDMDLLITDYSSVYFDFMITEKPILFFCYDLKYYKESDRGFLLPYEQYAPGEKIQDAFGLIESIVNVKNHPEVYWSKYRNIYKRINDEMNIFNDKPNFDMVDQIFID